MIQKVGIAESGIAVELSTAGLRKPVGELYPARAFAELCVEAGASFALSSDAHLPEQVGFGYEQAVAYLDSGRYLWNASMFVWRVDVFLEELGRQQPELYSGLTAIAKAWDTPGRAALLGDIWPTLPRISVDYAVMEGAAAAGRVGTVPGDFGWNDIGDFHTLGGVLPDTGDGSSNVVVGAADGEKPGVLCYDATGLVVVPNSGRLVAALGVHDLIVVDTPDVLLVCPRDRAQEVKKLVDELKERGEHGYV